MQNIVLLLLITCITKTSFAQSGLSFKIYQNTDIFQTRLTDYRFGNVATENNINFSRISLAFDLITKKGFAHEVEILIPEFSKPIEKLQFPIQYTFRKEGKLEGEAYSYSLRYEINKLLADKSERIDFLLGLGINPYYVKLESIPNSPNAYYSSLVLYGFALNVTPRFYYKLNRLFTIELNAPIRIYNFQREKNRIDDPLLPLRQQRINQIDHLFFEPAYTIRLGLRYSLNK